MRLDDDLKSLPAAAHVPVIITPHFIDGAETPRTVVSHMFGRRKPRSTDVRPSCQPGTFVRQIIRYIGQARAQAALATDEELRAALGAAPPMPARIHRGHQDRQGTGRDRPRVGRQSRASSRRVCPPSDRRREKRHHRDELPGLWSAKLPGHRGQARGRIQTRRAGRNDVESHPGQHARSSVRRPGRASGIPARIRDRRGGRHRSRRSVPCGGVIHTRPRDPPDRCGGSERDGQAGGAGRDAGEGPGRCREPSGFGGASRTIRRRAGQAAAGAQHPDSAHASGVHWRRVDRPSGTWGVRLPASSRRFSSRIPFPRRKTSSC